MDMSFYAMKSHGVFLETDKQWCYNLKVYVPAKLHIKAQSLVQ